MFPHERVVVPHDTAGLRRILVIVEAPEGKISQFPLVLLDIEYVGVGIHVLEPVGIHLDQPLEPLQTDVEL